MGMAVIQWLALMPPPGPGTGELGQEVMTVPFPGFCGDSGPVCEESPQTPSYLADLGGSRYSMSSTGGPCRCTPKPGGAPTVVRHDK